MADSFLARKPLRGEPHAQQGELVRITPFEGGTGELGEVESVPPSSPQEEHPVTTPTDTQPDRYQLTWAARALPNPNMSLTGDYLEYVWLPLLGPSAVLVLRRLGRILGAPDHHRTHSIGRTALAAGIGVGDGGGRNAPIVRTLHRLERFGFIEITGDHIRVNPTVRPVPPSLVDRLPGPSLAVHHAITATTAGAA